MTTAASPRLRPFERRPLSTGEMLIARFMFGDEKRFARTQVIQAPRLGFGAMTPLSGAIVFSHWNAARDFSASPLDERGWFVHELTHVWQALTGIVMPLAKLGALGAGAYAYKYESGKPFYRYNIEQQAEIGRHLFLARSGAPDPQAPPSESLEAIWPAR